MYQQLTFLKKMFVEKGCIDEVFHCIDSIAGSV